VKAGDAPAAFHADLAFHETLFGLVEDVTLQSAIAEYARQTNAMRFSALFSPGHRERAGQEHAALIEALRKGQRKALVALCRAHLLPFSAA
jgi:DNA-binding GntR family transcriptional regulator